MTQADDRQHRSILLERGLLPDFLPQARVELGGIKGPAIRTEESTRDLRHLVWCSIDNDDSRDLDQLTVAEVMPGGTAKIPVAIADVDAIVKKQSALDDRASVIKCLLRRHWQSPILDNEQDAEVNEYRRDLLHCHRQSRRSSFYRIWHFALHRRVRLTQNQVRQSTWSLGVLAPSWLER